MRFRVIIPFRFRGNVVKKDQLIEPNTEEATRLLASRVVGIDRPEQAVKPPAERPAPTKPEQAVKKPGERRGRKKVKDESAAGERSGD